MDCRHDMNVSTIETEFASDSRIIVRQRRSLYGDYVVLGPIGGFLLWILYATCFSKPGWGSDDLRGVFIVGALLAAAACAGVLMALYRRTVTIGVDKVECRSSCILPLADWKVDRSEYRGVLLRRTRRPRFDLCLYHPSGFKSLRIYESNRYADVLARWKEWTARLGLPGLEYDGDEIVELAPGDIDKNLAELLSENKVSIPQDALPFPVTMPVEKSESSISIRLGRDKNTFFLLLATACFILLLIVVGAIEQSTTPEYASAYHYLIYYYAAAFVAVAGGSGVLFYSLTESVIRMDRERLTLARVTKSGRDLFRKTLPIGRIRFIHAAYPNFYPGFLMLNGLTVSTFDGAYDIVLDCGAMERESVKRVLMEWIAGGG